MFCDSQCFMNFGGILFLKAFSKFSKPVEGREKRVLKAHRREGKRMISVFFNSSSTALLFIRCK